MPTRTFVATKSSLFAVTGSTELGGGQDQHMPIGGPWNGYTFISAVQFALDFSGMTRITGASLYLKTTGQVHIGFASAYVYCYRCTGSWTANGSSSSAEGGSGWGTSPTVYPGPPITTTGGSSRDISDSENVWVYPDLTAIVKAWAPSSVEGGGGAPNYGVRLSAKSNTRSEFYSFEASSGNRPYLVVSYETDQPPAVPTVTTPTPGSTTSDTTPLLACTSVDPDGDPIEVGDVEVRKSTTVVYTGSSGSSLQHSPTTALPSGDLEQRWRARANGVYSGWSAWTPFTVDRAPTVVAFTAPPATVNGTRRPPITATTQDLDLDALEMFDVRVYAAPGGTVTGDPVYSRTNLTSGISGSAGSQTVTHTPVSDLPPGEAAARIRVRARGVWSSWSSYRMFNVVVAVPSVVFLTPAADYGFGRPALSTLESASTALMDGKYWLEADVRPPAGATLTQVRRVGTRLDGPGAPVVVYSSDFTLQPAGGVYSLSRSFNQDGFTVPYGTMQWEVKATASNGGITTVIRIARNAFGEWQGSIALGDSVTDLAITGEVPKVDIAVLMYRAMTSPTAFAAGSSWLPASSIATVQAQLPATNAYLGIWVRMVRQADDADLLDGSGSFETSSLAPWSGQNGVVATEVNGNAVDGSRVVRVTGDGSTAAPNARSPNIPVIPGATYKVTGSAARSAGAKNGRLRIDTFDASGAAGPADVAGVGFTNATPLVPLSFTYVIPTDGSVGSIVVRCMLNSSVATSADSWVFDAVTVVGPAPGAGGLERICIDWSSLG